MNPEKTHLYKKQYQQPIEEETPPKKGNGLSTNTYTKKSSYTMVVTHFLGEGNAKFVGGWILHINHLIGTLKSYR